MAKVTSKPWAELVSIDSRDEQVKESACRDFDVVLPPTIEQSPFKDRYLEKANECEMLYSESAISDNFGEFKLYSRCDATRLIIGRYVEYIRMLEILQREPPIVIERFKIDRENDSATLIES